MYDVVGFDNLSPGVEGTLERTVEGELLTRHVGGKGTFATPAMIGLMEITSHRSVERFLNPGYTTVGYEVHVRHLAPAAPGTQVVITTRLAEVNGRKLRFEVSCRQGDTVIGEGLHERAVVPADF
jgi:predicted thioesterase